MKLSASLEDYLEAIYVLETSEVKVHSVEISHMLHVSKAAVSKAMNELLEKDLVEKTPYSDLKLTDKGREVAKNVYHRHVTIRNFLIKLGVDKITAENDCCMIEHVISPETLKAMEKALKN